VVARESEALVRSLQPKYSQKQQWETNKPGVIQMHCVIVNFEGGYSDIYAGELIVGRKRDKDGIIRDTIRVVSPDTKLNYFFDYPDIPNDTVWIQVMFGPVRDTASYLREKTLAIWDEEGNMNL
jgi:hypothetical protein